MSPARLFDNLKVSQKLFLISFSFFLPIAVLLFLLIRGINYDINFSQYEFYGDTYQRPLEKLLKTIPEHGLLFKQQQFRPSEATNAKLQLVEKRVDEGIAALRSIDAELGAVLQFTEDGLAKRKRTHFRVATLDSEWKALKAAKQTLSAQEAEERHRHLKEDIRTMITHMGDTSNLILDPDLDSYYTMDVTLLALPQTQDRLGEIVSYGLGAIGKGGLTSEERTQIAVYAAQLKEADMDRVVTSLQTSLIEDPNFLGVNPHFQKIIPPALVSYKEKTSAFIAMLQSIANQPNVSVSVDKFVESGMAARDESFALWDVAVDGEDSYLQTRVTDFRKSMAKYLLLTLLSLVVSVLLAYAITRSITRPLRLVANNLRAQATMDFTRKIVLSRSDELGQMARGINQVVETLRVSIQKIIGSSHSLSTSSHALAMASVELSQSVEHSPFLKGMVENTQDVAKEVAQHAAELQKIAQQFKFR